MKKPKLTAICEALGLPCLSDEHTFQTGRYAMFSWCQTDISGLKCWVVLQEWRYGSANDVWILLDNPRNIRYWKLANHISVTRTDWVTEDAFSPHELLQSKSTKERHKFFNSLGAYRIANVKTPREVAEKFNPTDAARVLFAAVFSL